VIYGQLKIEATFDLRKSIFDTKKPERNEVADEKNIKAAPDKN
jgi:hypothetical protein